MPSKLGSLIRQVTRKPDEKLNILSFVFHERYSSMIAKTGHNFYFLQSDKTLKWNEIYEPLPSNCFVLNALPHELDIDLILSPAKKYAIEARKISKLWHLPILNLEVFIPDISESPKLIEKIHRQSEGNWNIFIDEYSMNKWQWSKEKTNVSIIEHGIDTELFQYHGEERKHQIITIANDFVKRGWSHGYPVWQQLSEEFPLKLIGNNPGISEPLTLSELITEMSSSKIYLNTTLEVPVPTSMMEAMACGCPVVALDTCEIYKFFDDSAGFLCKNIQEIKEALNILMNNNDIWEEKSRGARELIMNYYPISNFIKKWDLVLKTTANMPYTGELYEI